MDAYSAPWALSHLHRQDVEQADIAALMSALLGVAWPVNSVGVLPEVRRGVLESRSAITVGGSGEDSEANGGRGERGGMEAGTGGYLDLGEAGLAGVGWTNAKVRCFCWCCRFDLRRREKRGGREEVCVRADGTVCGTGHLGALSRQTW